MPTDNIYSLETQINNAVYCRGKLIGINAYVDYENKVLIYEELPKKLDVQCDINAVDYIVNLSDIKKPSSYYKINH